MYLHFEPEASSALHILGFTVDLELLHLLKPFSKKERKKRFKSYNFNSLTTRLKQNQSSKCYLFPWGSNTQNQSFLIISTLAFG